MTERVPEDLERGVLAVAEAPVVEAAPEAEPVGPAEWIRKSLFSSWFNGLLTVLTAAFILWGTFRLLRFVFVTAEWRVFQVNLRAYMVGRFPQAEIWRVWSALYVVLALVGLSRGVLPRARWGIRGLILRMVLSVIFVLLLLYLLESGGVWILSVVAAGIFAAGVGVGRMLGRRLRKLLIVAWILVFPAVVLLLVAAGGVGPRGWGGFMLNILVAVVGIFVSFPVGLLLALGRRSSLPVVRTFCVGFIEFVRGVPLVTLLIFGLFVVPLLLPPQLRLPDIVLFMVMVVIFSAAYVAEITRGGLQGVPWGQYEAGRALGLSTTRLMARIILPQALRNTIPAMISHFISLFKDTTLLAAVGTVSELLATARRSVNDLRFVGDDAEALFPAALIFFAVAFSMSRWSQRLEKRVGVGER